MIMCDESCGSAHSALMATSMTFCFHAIMSLTVRMRMVDSVGLFFGATFSFTLSLWQMGRQEEAAMEEARLSRWAPSWVRNNSLYNASQLGL